MIKFKEILLERDIRNKNLDNLSDIRIINFIKKNCSNFYNNWSKITPLYRGIYDNLENNIILSNPKKLKFRKSLSNQGFLLNGIIDATWSNYPKRSKSIIISTSKKFTEDFGETFVLIPFDNALIAICPDRDVIEFGYNLIEEIDSITRYSFNKLFNKFDENILKKITKKIVKDYISSYNPYRVKIIIDFSRSKYNNLYDYLCAFYNPKKLGFSLQKYDKNFIVKGNHEVWTESKCLLIDTFYFGEYIKKLLPQK